MTSKTPVRVLIALVASCALVSACDIHIDDTVPPLAIYNDTTQAVVLDACAQEPHMNLQIASKGTFNFTGRPGTTYLSDDPGFACTLTTASGELMCLPVPTSGSAKDTFSVSEAKPTESFAKCVAHSNSHI
jgi:hypothetical protein